MSKVPFLLKYHTKTAPHGQMCQCFRDIFAVGKTSQFHQQRFILVQIYKGIDFVHFQIKETTFFIFSQNSMKRLGVAGPPPPPPPQKKYILAELNEATGWSWTKAGRHMLC